MRRLAVVFAVATVVAMAASAAFAQGDQQIQLNNRNSDPKWSTYTPKPDGTLWNSPTATTGGALWLNNGSSVALLPATQDINLELWAQAPAPYGWTRLVTDLLSAPDGQAASPSNGYIGSAYHDITQGFNEPGMFYDVNGSIPEIPGTNNVSGPSTYFNVELYAWMGPYDSFAAAVAAGSPVGDSGVFNQYVPYAEPPPVPSELDSLPATILKAELPGDANTDGKVDINDLTIVLANYGQSSGMRWSTGDFNNDGKVDINDLTIVLANYGHSVGAADSGVAAVPEPASLLLLAAAVLALLAYAQRKRK